MAKTKPKPLNLALQGGGAHGAFTWGVLDGLLEDGRLEVTGISGTSAGAMNATVLASGLAAGGPDQARQYLTEFWRAVADAALHSPLKPTPVDKALSPGNMDMSPAWLMLDSMSRIFSPYIFNPLNLNPLREVLLSVVDFEALRECTDLKLFLSATNVKTGKIKVFQNHELSADAALASACLPFLHQAVAVDGEYYWDGGFLGNPAIFPLIYGTDCRDVLLVQINPIVRDEVPRTAQAIFDRINELSFNSSLMREMRAIHFVGRMIEENRLDPRKYKQMLIHVIPPDDEMQDLGVSSKLNADWDFLRYLHDRGRDAARAWIAENFDKVGSESSVDIAEVYL